MTRTTSQRGAAGCSGSLERDRLDSDLDAELEAHLQIHVDDNLRRRDDAVGGAPAGAGQARRPRADRRSGIAIAAGFRRSTSCCKDLRFAWRLLRRSPGFPAVVAPDAGGRHRRQHRRCSASSTPCCCGRCPTATPIASCRSTADGPRPPPRRSQPRPTTTRIASARRRSTESRRSTVRPLQPDRRRRPRARPDAHRVVGVFRHAWRDTAGRPGLRLREEQRGSHRVAILSDALWRRRFGADPAIVGQPITLNGEPLHRRRRPAGRVLFPRRRPADVRADVLASGRQPELAQQPLPAPVRPS